MCDCVREASAGFAKTAEEQDELVEATRFWLLLRRLVLARVRGLARGVHV